MIHHQLISVDMLVENFKSRLKLLVMLFESFNIAFNHGHVPSANFEKKKFRVVKQGTFFFHEIFSLRKKNCNTLEMTQSFSIGMQNCGYRGYNSRTKFFPSGKPYIGQTTANFMLVLFLLLIFWSFWIFKCRLWQQSLREFKKSSCFSKA